MWPLVILALCALVSANSEPENITYYPQCDLVSRDGNWTTNIFFDQMRLGITVTWKKNLKNYKTLKSNTLLFRFGPIKDDAIAKETAQTELTTTQVNHITVYELSDGPVCGVTYGFQICGPNSTSAILDDNDPLLLDYWEHAWTYIFKLVPCPGGKEQPPVTIAPNNNAQVAVSFGVGNATGTSSGVSNETAPTSRKAEPEERTYNPVCDLVQTSYVDVDKDYANKTLSMFFAWDERSSSYQSIGKIDHYVVRYGPATTYGGNISEAEARYLNVDKDSHEFVMRGITPGKMFTLQICAATDPKDDTFDWSKAWIGSMDFTSDYYTTFPNIFQDETPAPTGEVPRPEVNETEGTTPLDPHCDLVSTSYVGVGKDDDTKTLSMSFAWDKKESSYNAIGPIDHYVVRHGPISTWGGQIKDSDAKYEDVDNSNVVISNIVPGTLYGVQICALAKGDANTTFNWADAWVGSMDFTSPFYSDFSQEPPMMMMKGVAGKKHKAGGIAS